MKVIMDTVMDTAMTRIATTTMIATTMGTIFIAINTAMPCATGTKITAIICRLDWRSGTVFHLDWKDKSWCAEHFHRDCARSTILARRSSRGLCRLRHPTVLTSSWEDT